MIFHFKSGFYALAFGLVFLTLLQLATLQNVRYVPLDGIARISGLQHYDTNQIWAYCFWNSIQLRTFCRVPLSIASSQHIASHIHVTNFAGVRDPTSDRVHFTGGFAAPFGTLSFITSAFQLVLGSGFSTTANGFYIGPVFASAMDRVEEQGRMRFTQYHLTYLVNTTRNNLDLFFNRINVNSITVLEAPTTWSLPVGWLDPVCVGVFAPEQMQTQISVINGRRVLSIVIGGPRACSGLYQVELPSDSTALDLSFRPRRLFTTTSAALTETRAFWITDDGLCSIELDSGPERKATCRSQQLWAAQNNIVPNLLAVRDQTVLVVHQSRSIEAFNLDLSSRDLYLPITSTVDSLVLIDESVYFTSRSGDHAILGIAPMNSFVRELPTPTPEPQAPEQITGAVIGLIIGLCLAFLLAVIGWALFASLKVKMSRMIGKDGNYVLLNENFIKK